MSLAPFMITGTLNVHGSHDNDESTLSCHRCGRIIKYGEKVARALTMNGRGERRADTYHLRCLPPVLFHQAGQSGGSRPPRRVAPD